MKQRLKIALCLLLLVRPVYGAPPRAVALAADDARSLPADVALRTRYLDLSYEGPDERGADIPLIDGWLNHLSRCAAFGHARPLANSEVLAIDLNDFGLWSKDPIKDKLAGQTVFGLLGSFEAKEPWFHRPAKTKLSDGSYRNERVIGTWLPQRDITDLIRCCGSRVPIVRADWFVRTTCQQVNRGKEGQQFGYYDFIGVGKKAEDFWKLIGANPAEARRLELQMAERVRRSGVTLHARGIDREGALTGGHWFTTDFNDDTDERNPLRLLRKDTNPAHGDASRQYGVKANRLFIFWLQDGKGNRADAAPDFIASDQRGFGNDSRVHIARSCIGCHVEGLRPVKGFVREVFDEPDTLRSLDPETNLELKRLYRSDLYGQLDLDRAVYAKALQDCCGLSPAEFSARFKSLILRAEDDDVTPAIAAREMGVPEEQLLAALRKYVQDRPDKLAIADPLIVGFAKPGQHPDGRPKMVPLRREHFEELIPTFYDMLGGVLP